MKATYGNFIVGNSTKSSNMEAPVNVNTLNELLAKHGVADRVVMHHYTAYTHYVYFRERPGQRWPSEQAVDVLIEALSDVYVVTV